MPKDIIIILRRTLIEIEQERRKNIDSLYRLIDRLEGRPEATGKYHPFPIGTLEKVIDQSLIGFEQWVHRMVTALLKRLRKR